MASLVLTDAQILAALGDGVKKSVGGLPNYWNTLVARGHSWAVNQILGRLSARGYSAAQITSADQTADYEMHLALFWIYKNGGIPEGYDDKNLKALDLRTELSAKGDDAICLTAGGAFLQPVGPQGIPGSGLISAADDIFQYPPTDGEAPFPPGEFAADSGEGIRW